ncbi:hypothetical protein CANMA_001088 [Candida margitis]|uniref:uncharacterized protein n=1 Tax=Candida margitis TaxID=1775924 RepID=UPI002225E0F2|nr:uncharacterized protein CANMA_001088 [Candida margitis]KAI5969889.1 hypothetical protein CANMA_001088 [Candida margitis]
MSETAAVNSTAAKKQPPQSRLKQLTSASSWVSPFRSQADEQDAKSKKKVNLYKQFKDDNKVEHIKVPAKFAHHPTLEAEAKKKKKQAKSTNSTKKTGDEKAKKTTDDKAKTEEQKLEDESKEKLVTDEPSTAAAEEQNLEDESKEKLVTDEPSTAAAEEQNLEDESKEKLVTDEPSTAAAEEPKGKATTDEGLERKQTNESRETLLKDEDQAEDPSEKAKEDFEAAEADIENAKKEADDQEAQVEQHLEGDDEIVENIKENPVDISSPPQTKYEPVEKPNKEILEKLKDKPVLLKHYQELNATAVGSLANDLDDPKKVIELGSGLRMTQAQLLDMAAKRVAPVITSINDEVSKTRQEDEIKRQQILDQKVKKHEGKLKSDFDKYAAKVAKRKETFNHEIERKLADIANLVKTSDDNAAKFEKKTKDEIETAAKEYEERENKAVEKHASDKETIEKNHDELIATKKQELEDAKTGQETAAQEIEDLKQKRIDFTEKNSELDTEIERLKSKLEEEKAKLQELRSQHDSHQDAIEVNQNQSKELNEKIGGYQKDIDDKKTTHKGLVAEVGVLGAALGAFAAKLADVNSDKTDRTERLTEAKNKHIAWQKDKDHFAEEAAREHERQRAQATQEYETRKHQEELERKRQKEEQERLEKEEQERQAKLEEEERKRQAQLEAEEKERQAKLEEEERQRKAEEEAKAKELKEKQEKEAAVAEKLRQKEAKQRNLEEERNKHDSIFQQGTYSGDESTYQNAQKQRLGDEITNLQKIKELREERATFTGEDPKSDDLEKLIKERQKAIKKIENKQSQAPLKESAVAEEPTSSKNLVASGTGAAAGTVFGQDLIEKQSKLPSAQENPSADYDTKKKNALYGDAEKSVPKIEDDTKKEPKDKRAGLGSAALAAGAVGAGSGAGVGAATKSSENAAPLSKERSNSLTDRFKGWGRRLSSKDKIPTEKSKEKALTASKEPRDSNVGVSSKDTDNKPAIVSKNDTGKENNIAAAPKGNDIVGGVNANDIEDKTGSARVIPKGSQTIGGVNANDIESKDTHGHSAAIAAGANSNDRDDSSWDVHSVYELVSDGEFEANKNDPNYFAVNEADYNKHKESEKNFHLFDKIH